MLIKFIVFFLLSIFTVCSWGRYDSGAFKGVIQALKTRYAGYNKITAEDLDSVPDCVEGSLSNHCFCQVSMDTYCCTASYRNPNCKVVDDCCAKVGFGAGNAALNSARVSRAVVSSSTWYLCAMKPDCVITSGSGGGKIVQ